MMTTEVTAVKQVKVTMIVLMMSNASDSEGEDESDDVILAFIAADVKDVDERPVATRSGRASSF